VQVLDEHQDAGPGVGAADAACDCLCPAGRPSSTSEYLIKAREPVMSFESTLAQAAGAMTS
jgi:hypothetical protein